MRDNNQQWKAQIRIDIPEFYDNLQIEFLDWIANVEVPKDRKVHLVATQLRGCASTQWQ